MKTLLKFILGIIIFLIIVIGVPLGILYYNISDSTDNTPIDVYDDEITYSTVMTNLFNENLDLENKNSIDFTFSEEELNKFIFGLIKNRINNNYNPQKTNPTDEEAYIAYTDISLPVLGERQVLIKSAYAELVDDNLEIYITIDLLGVKSRAKLIASFEEDSENYKIVFETIGVGKLNLFSGLGKLIFNAALKNTNNQSINNDLIDKKLPFRVDLDNHTLLIPKDEINLLLMQLIDTNSMDDSGQAEMLSSFIEILANKENDLLNFGIINNKFGLSFDLTKLKVNQSLATLNNDVKTFDSTIFMQSKVQGYIISTLSNMDNAKMYFSNTDLNKIVYDQSNGYEAFTVSIPLPNSTSTFDFTVEGILLSFSTTSVSIRIIINLNGLKTSLVLKADVENNNSSVITLKVNDQITLGKDIDEVAGDYITANANLILGLLGNNIDDLGIMSYNSNTKSLIISAASFTQLMAVEGTNVSPLTVDKLKIVNGGLEAYAKPGTLGLPVIETANAVKNVLTSNSFDESDFNTSDEEEAQKVSDLLDTIDSISDSITNDALKEEDTDALINNYNALSEENKVKFLEKLETESASPDLLDLYDSLFGK